MRNPTLPKLVYSFNTFAEYGCLLVIRLRSMRQEDTLVPNN